ncbi:rhoptry protein, putative [Eimeria necatrix]|uniref:Rhoptry protein, putative n=1 Tax=Eimeria necatrix TaxID=51315 RepID=U6N1C0_9EIME|nr:rhoptry protein, putative [Eimeria necatrix]CDJ67745.1 rhoptry protein, putative [Eimeria necatrix]
MPKLTTGVAGRWSFPLTQGWPLDKETTTNKDREDRHKDEERDTPQAIDEEAQTLLEKQPREGAGGSGASTARPRSCCCYYWPDVVEWLEARRLPRGSVDSMQRHLAAHWWQSLVEGLVAAAVLWCSWLVATPDNYAVWAVLCLFFLALLQASFSAFVTRTTASFVFTELVLSAATLVSFSNMFTYGPEVWSVWLTSCLVTILAIFSFSTLRNAALVTKLHVEVLLLTLLIVLSIPVVTDASFEPFQVLNTYGALGKIQKERYELIVQGTDDEKLTIDTKWQNYEFQCKPTSLHKAPCYSGPYHHRLDWLMRLVALEEKQSALSHHEWFPKFLSALLKNNSYVTGLLRHNPFREEPPTHIRVLRAEYHFTKRKNEGLIFSNGPWWEIRRGSTKVFMEPHEVPGAQPHLQKVLAERAERQRVAEAAAAAAAAARRRREEEEELWRRVVEAKRAAEKLKKQQEEQQQREKERREVEERGRREAAAKAQAAAAEAQRAKEEAERKAAEEKKRKEEEAEAARKAQQEAAAKAEAERRAVELEKQKEKERQQEAQRQQQEAAEKQRHVEELAKAGELQRQREEEKRRHELAEEAERRRKQEAQRQKEEQQRQQQLAERQAKLEEEQKQKMQRIQQLLISITKQIPGGVPLREAARLSRKARHRAAAAMLKSE